MLLITTALVWVLTTATPRSVPIPGQGWEISFEAPPLGDIGDETRGRDYMWRARSDRFNISFFVEEPTGPGRTNRHCYEYYWPKGRRNPLIDQKSVQVTQTPRYVRVQYDIVVPFQGREVRMINVNYYFTYRDRWVDVHISVIGATDEDMSIFPAFDSSLSYGT